MQELLEPVKADVLDRLAETNPHTLNVVGRDPLGRVALHLEPTEAVLVADRFVAEPVGLDPIVAPPLIGVDGRPKLDALTDDIVKRRLRPVLNNEEDRLLLLPLAGLGKDTLHLVLEARPLLAAPDVDLVRDDEHDGVLVRVGLVLAADDLVRLVRRGKFARCGDLGQPALLGGLFARDEAIARLLRLYDVVL